MEMISERSNKGKGKLIEGDDHCPSQNHLSGSDNQQQNFGGGRGTTEAAVPATADGASSSDSASEKKRLPLKTNPHRLQWTGKLHKHFVHAMEELLRRDKKVTPKAVLEEMGIDGIILHHVKSHLQRHREGRITETNWQVPRGTRLKNNKAAKFDGPKSASECASTSSLEHDRNGPGMGDQNVGGNLETGTVTTPLYSALQQHQVDVADISAANGGRFMTSNGYPFLGLYNNPSSSTAINNVQADLQIHTLGFVDHNGSFYPFQPGDGNHWVQLAQYCGALGNIQQGNELAHEVQQPAQYCRALGNIQQGNELAHEVQQPAQDGGALGNIQQQNQPQAATDNVQAQNATPENMETSEDWMGYIDWDSYLNQDIEDF